MDKLKSIKFIHCADLHLDTPFSSLGKDSSKTTIRRQDIKLAFQKIISLAAEKEVDLLLIAGDLYEHDYVKKSTIHFICDQFEKIKDTRVLITPGNHDPDVKSSYYSHFPWPDNVEILKKGDCFNGLSHKGIMVYCDFYETEDPGQVIGQKNNLLMDNINILMLHGTLDLDVDKNAYNPVSAKKLCNAGMDYIALGHFHNSFAGVEGCIYNPGSPEPLGFDEEGEHGFFIVEIKKEDNKPLINAEFIKSNVRQYRNITVDLSNMFSEEEIAKRIKSETDLKENPQDLFRVFLTGYRSRDFNINTQLVEEMLKSFAFFIKIVDKTSPDYNFAKIAKDPGLRGLFVSKMLEKLEYAKGTEEEHLIKKALYYGLEAIDRGEIS